MTLADLPADHRRRDRQGRSPIAGVRLVLLLALRGLRRRRAEAALLLLAVTTATTTLSFAFALGSVTDAPWDATRARTSGPDVWIHADRAADVDVVMRRPGVVAAGPVRPLYYVPRLDAGRGAAAALVQIADDPRAPVDRPALVSGTWAVPGRVVVERGFATALGVRPGDALTVVGHRVRVSGVAMTTTRSPYPMNTPGLVWAGGADEPWLRASAVGRQVAVALRLADPATATAFAHAVTTSDRSVVATPWQATRHYAVSERERTTQTLHVGAWSLALLAVAGVAVLASGRVAGQRRRAGLLKALGGSPRTVTAVLMTEHLLVAVVAAGIGLVAGRVVAPLLIQPETGLLDVEATPTVSAGQAAVVVAVAAALMCAATLPTAWSAARTSTGAALTAGARTPRRSARLIALSAWTPVSVLIGLRLASRRPARSVLSALSLTLTTGMVVAALAMRHYTDTYGLRAPVGTAFVPGMRNPVMDRVDSTTVTVMIALIALAVMNTLLIGWATVLDFVRGTALLRTLGAAPGQVTVGVLVANLFPAAAAGLLGIPVGLGIFRLAARLGGMHHEVVSPPATWLAPVPLGVLVVVTLLMLWPARAGARRPVTRILASE